VIHDLAHGVVTARARARISALVVNASLVRRAIRVDDALRSAVWWSTSVACKT
jgi:hypothetical protein